MRQGITIEESNILAHLVEGNIKVAMKCIQRQKQCVEQILDRYINELSIYLEQPLQDVMDNHGVQDQNKNRDSKRKNRDTLFLQLVGTLQKKEYKTILLPATTVNHEIIDLTSKQLLKDIIDVYGKDRGIVLQTEKIVEKHIAYEKLFKHLEVALNFVDEWPGILVWKEDNVIFVPVRSTEDVIGVYQTLKNEKDPIGKLKQGWNRSIPQKLQIIHISDLHCGSSDIEENKQRLLEQLREEINRLSQRNEVSIVISGDCVDSPIPSDYEVYKQFLIALNRGNSVEINVVLGNHDCTNNGFKITPNKNENYITEKIASKDPVVEIRKKKNLIIIQFNSNKGGMFAQGQIGSEQLLQVDRYLETIEDIHDYTLMGILHHHPVQIERPDWYAGEWYENIYEPATEAALKLVDSEAFMEWANDTDIKLLLHGHRHIPDYNQFNNTAIIGCGSSTGKIVHTDNDKTYITYNVINYNPLTQRFTSCIEWYEEVLGEGFKNSIVHLEM